MYVTNQLSKPSRPGLEKINISLSHSLSLSLSLSLTKGGRLELIVFVSTFINLTDNKRFDNETKFMYISMTQEKKFLKLTSTFHHYGRSMPKWLLARTLRVLDRLIRILNSRSK